MENEYGSLPLNTNDDMVACRHALRELARKLGFSVIGSTALVASVGELARNALTYGGGARVTWEVRREGGKIGVRMTFEARGRTVPLEAPAFHAGGALRDAKRLVHEFASDPNAGAGSYVIVTCWR